MTEKELLEMGIHDEVAINAVSVVTRVLGGWIYRFEYSHSGKLTSTFVPEPQEFISVGNMAMTRTKERQDAS